LYLIIDSPGARWGTQEGYAYLLEAYLAEYDPPVVAIARPHAVCWTGDSVELDASRSYVRSWTARAAHRIGTESRMPDRYYRWAFQGGGGASGAKVQRVYARPGRYSEMVEVSDEAGHSSVDFAAVVVHDMEKQIGGSGGSLEPPVPLLEPPGPLLTHLHTVYTAYSECLPTRLNPWLRGPSCFPQVHDRAHPTRPTPSISLAHHPHRGIAPGQPVHFNLRSWFPAGLRRIVALYRRSHTLHTRKYQVR
jgi:hypothetical protein